MVRGDPADRCLRRPRPADPVRAGQPVALGTRRRARPALPVGPAAGEADARRRRSRVHGRRGRPAGLADAGPRRHDRGVRRRPGAVLGPGLVRPRVRRARRHDRDRVLLHGALQRRHRGRDPLGRSRARDPVAGRRAAHLVQGRGRRHVRRLARATRIRRPSPTARPADHGAARVATSTIGRCPRATTAGSI